MDEQIGRINADCAARGAYHSSARLLLLERSFTAELGSRATLIWRNIVRVHEIYGTDESSDISAEFKAIFSTVLNKSAHDLGQMLAFEQTRGGGTNTTTNTFQSQLPYLIKKHFVEIDLYCVSLARRQIDRDRANGPSYNFYGSVGSLQTGANATSSVVQSIGRDDKERLKISLSDVLTELSSSGMLESTYDELKGLVNESIAELDKAKSNGLKLMSLLTTLGNTVQTMACAPVAYQNLKAATLPFGVMLP
ncbi:hypothetical protein [Burkholderia ambifaria]|uniref:hypothetical protein n=1 Tax=Burkholderia ambifaria TaxID=152480 RepID=UPI00158BF281|nr:hypothetical protein [Burkholderia ambifaria]